MEEDNYKELKKQFPFLDDLLEKILENNRRSGHKLEPIIKEIRVEERINMPPKRRPESGPYDFWEIDYHFPPHSVRAYCGIPSHGTGESVGMQVVIYHARTDADLRQFVIDAIRNNEDHYLHDAVKDLTDGGKNNMIVDLHKLLEEDISLPAQARTNKILSEIFSMKSDHETADYFERKVYDKITELTDSIIESLEKPCRYRHQSVTVKSPARIEFGSGAASDTPLISMEKGGAALHLSANLDGEEPIEVNVRKLEENAIRLHSKDLQEKEIITRREQLADLRGPLRLLKASADLIIPQEHNLPVFLARIGGGFELITHSKISKNSGLGTSGILTAAILKCLHTIFGHSKSAIGITKEVLHIEQLCGIGGGWQDPLGGLVGGIKYIQCPPGDTYSWDPRPQWEFLDGRNADELERRLVLYHTEQTSPGYDLLKKRVEIYLSKEPLKYEALIEAKEVVKDMRDSLRQNNISQFGETMTEYWNTLKRIGDEATSQVAEQLYSELEDLIDGMKMATFSAHRGFMLLLAKEGRSEELKGKLEERGGKVYDFSVNFNGMQVELR